MEQRRKERIDRGIKVRTDGLYAVMSWRELSYLTLPRMVLIVGMLILPFVMPSMYWQRVISIVCIYALLAVSFDLLAHFVGLVSLGGALFIGVGGYLSAIMNTSFGFPPLLAIPIATIVGAGICTLLLLPCLPLRGVYFAIVSLMYPLAMTPGHRGPGYFRGHGRDHGYRQLSQSLDRAVFCYPDGASVSIRGETAG